jgi:hypothetical protein
LHSKVIGALELKSSDCIVLESIKRSLAPDNAVTPRDMFIRDVFERAKDSCIYKLEVEVEGDLAHALKRSSSTVNEVLLIIKSILRAYEELER